MDSKGSIPMHCKHRIALVVALIAVMVTCFMAGRQFQILADSTRSDLGAGRALSVVRIASTGGASAPEVADDVDLQPLETFSTVLGHVTRSYVEPIKDRTKLTYGAIRGMLASLEDPFTGFLEPQEYQSFLEENQGHFEGIGATIGFAEIKTDEKMAKMLPGFRCPACGSEVTPRSFRISIVSPLPGSPAGKAGLQAGDLILKIDGVPTEGMSLTEAVKKIRGQRGTPVKLLIGRQRAEQPIAKEVVRGPIDVTTVETKMLPGGIGYMRLNYFYDGTGAAVARGLKELRGEHMRGLVLDVRNNPGGLLNRCVEVAQQFVAQEAIVHVQERGQPMRPFHGADRGKGHRFDLPLVVLVNKGSASASEILAGAIQDAQVGKLVGTGTYGKGSVQTIQALPDGSAIRLTTAKWYTLKRRDIDRKGVAPDVVVENPPTAAPDGVQDAQYEKALEMLRQQLAAGERLAAHPPGVVP